MKSQKKISSPGSTSSSRLIWKGGEHSAFPDLIFYKNSLFCSFRESDSHAGDQDGKIRILKSDDEGETWTSVACLEKEKTDLRDPHFSIMPDGRLLLSMGGSLYQKGKFISRSPHVAFSNDGVAWSSPQDLQRPGEWIWRMAWSGEVGYGITYHFPDAKPLTLLKTVDGLSYTAVAEFSLTGHPSEASLGFLSDQSLVVLVRRAGNALIGSSKAPFTEWTWKEASHRIGGPHFVVLPDDKIWMGARFYRPDGKKTNYYTAVGPMTLSDFEPTITFDSSGDTGYPGLAFHDGKLFVCYYSSHEKNTAIYFYK